MCCGKMENISLADLVENKVLHRVKEERNILHAIKRRKADWTAYMVRVLETHCPRKDIRENESDWKHGRRHKQLLYDFKERTKY
jgi:hypothetical protein